MRKVTARQFFLAPYILLFALGLFAAFMLINCNFTAFLATVGLLSSISVCNYLMCENENITLDYYEELSNNCSCLLSTKKYLETIEKLNKKTKELEK